MRSTFKNDSVLENEFTLSTYDDLVDVVEPASLSGPMIHGWFQSLIKFAIWFNIMLLALTYFKNPLTAFRTFKRLKKLRSDLRGRHPVIKYARSNGRYYFTFNAPGWPSVAFRNYILNNIKKAAAPENDTRLDMVIFGITKKCGYQCEHCFEWNSLNKPETLTRENILAIIHSFQQAGVTQVQLSGGEPLNRFDDIIYILRNIKKGTDVWLYTSGYHLTKERTRALISNGCTGIVVSLDHWIPELHNKFRGRNNAFEWARTAVENAKQQGLLVCLSVCVTSNFITQHNLDQYAELARQWGISFIQLLEPKAVGHYEGKDVSLSKAEISLLEKFYLDYNFNNAYSEYPSVVYHGFYSRRVACGGSGEHYVYVDTDGDVHNCPFCQRKVFSALHGNLEDNLRLMRAGGCKTFVKMATKEKV